MTAREQGRSPIAAIFLDAIVVKIRVLSLVVWAWRLGLAARAT